MSEALLDVLEGRSPPDALALSGGDPELAAALRAALDVALGLLPVAEAPATPRELGPYRVERELGRGGMGTVLLGRHALLGRLAALKILPRPYSFVAENRERFRREAEAMARVRHPAVLPILEVGEADGIPYAALEYARGGTLEDVLRTMRGLDLEAARRRGEAALAGSGGYEERVAELVARVAEGLQAVHDSGVVHRDVKPSNLLLDGHGGVSLGDFGLALVSGAESLTQSGAIVGTRHYLAPERIELPEVAGASSDVYALGVTLYELLTLHPPFEGATELELLRSIREREPRRPRALNRRISPELEAVCLKAIEKRPSARYASADELAQDLRRALAGGAVRAPGPSRLRRAARLAWFHRRPVAAWSLGIGLAASLLVGGSFWRTVQASARDRDFVDAFREGEVLLVSDQAETTPVVMQRRERALELFERCTRLESGRTEAWLRRAEAALRLGRREEAAQAIARARELGAKGFYFERLVDWLETGGGRGPDELPRAADADVWSNWAPLDRFDLAYVHVLRAIQPDRASPADGAHLADAIEILLDAGLRSDPLLAPELLLLNCLAMDVRAQVSGTAAAFFSDPVAELRMALLGLERLRESMPDASAITYTHASLVSYAVFFGELAGPDREARMDDAERVFAEAAAATGTSTDAMSLVNLRMLKWQLGMKKDESLRNAIAELDALGRDRILALHDEHSFLNDAVQTLVLGGRYRQAYDLVRDYAFGKGRRQPPMRTVVFYRLENVRQGRIAPDVAGIDAFIRDVDSTLHPDDRKAAQPELDELRSRAASAAPK